MPSGEARPFATKISPKLIMTLFCPNPSAAPTRRCFFAARLPSHSAGFIRVKNRGWQLLETGSNAVESRGRDQQHRAGQYQPDRPDQVEIDPGAAQVRQ